jgi:hypothetical protein
MHGPSLRYTPAQREAIASAYGQVGVTAGRVVELAATGALEHSNGATLGAFHTTENTIRSVGRRARLRRERMAAATSTADLPPRDAVERLRRHLADAIDTELRRVEIEQEEGRAVSGETLRQVARAIRELASIPGPNDPRPPVPGAKVNGVRDGGETRGGLAGKILAASRAW